MTPTEKKIYDYVKANGENDSTSYIVWLDDTFNGVVDIAGCTDLLGIYASFDMDDEICPALSFLISSKDEDQVFITFSQLTEEIQNKILKFLNL